MTQDIEQKSPPAPVRTALTATQIIASLTKVNGWKLHGDGADVAIEKTYRFDNFLKTMSFVNAVAYMAEQQDHHPELLVTYGSCSVRFNTHDVHGVSRSDFECAALVDALLAS
ncbi:4a-hydroxytetrahydrobiopterin dehydratase [Rhodoferax saidenbachensis]|uniref:Putative pterin-4-alpha-carbinolamine dehydratase n=1 Tax=Rhodoferax saidenbachensis TaxID=1484693 RepID=A0ABU1ZM78_9BURK|nr:4a-hydroxytetrahydrobiopterin dehydratase [Rhodoferax saidenbachensis]MDR7306483.1 4a-hydroxytetrahydrobiopterin dehydratase [Rhodoferax saidenbachensis]